MKLYKILNFSNVKNNTAKLIQNIPRATISSPIYCCGNSLLSLKVSWARYSCMQMEHFHAHDDSEIDIWTIFWDEKQQFHAWQEYRSWQQSRHGKINNRSICISYTNAVNSLSRYCHEWLRPDLKIRFSNSSNKHGTGIADEIFTEIWRDSFSPCENSAKIPLESHEIPEGGSRSFLMGSYIRVLWMKKDNYREWTIKIKIKLQHHQMTDCRFGSLL